MSSEEKRSHGLRYADDANQAKVLRRVSKRVKQFETNELLLLQQTMVYEALRYEKDYEGKLCMGLAAPQVGKNLRVIMIRNSLNKHDQSWTFLFNPVYDSTEGDMQVETEGCLSVPYFTGKTVRPEISTFHYQDSKGNRVPVEGSAQVNGIYAQAICHEIDHLNGILFCDNAVDLKLTDQYKQAIDEYRITVREDGDADMDIEPYNLPDKEYDSDGSPHDIQDERRGSGVYDTRSYVHEGSCDGVRVLPTDSRESDSV